MAVIKTTRTQNSALLFNSRIGTQFDLLISTLFIVYKTSTTKSQRAVFLVSKLGLPEREETISLMRYNL